MLEDVRVINENSRLKVDQEVNFIEDPLHYEN